METYIIVLIVGILFLCCCLIFSSISGLLYENIKPSIGIYSRAIVSNNYTENGLNFNDSVTFCTNNKGKVATQDQLNEANAKGFENCLCGWLINSSGNPEAGYVMVNPPTGGGCGNPGYNTCSSDTTQLYGTYCYGPIPKSNIIDKSMVLP